MNKIDLIKEISKNMRVSGTMKPVKNKYSKLDLLQATKKELEADPLAKKLPSNVRDQMARIIIENYQKA